MAKLLEEKEGNFMIKGQQRPKLHEAKMTELKGEIDNLAIIVGNLNASLSIMNMKTRQKINKEMEDLNNPVNQLDLIGTTDYSTQ